jgi:MFS family permease
VRESRRAGEHHPGASAKHRREAARTGRLVLGLSHASWRLVSRFMVTAATNGLAIGMLGPLLVYWFYRRFGVDAAEIGKLYFVLNLVAAAPYLLAGRMAARYGSVNAVVVCRSVASVLLGVMVVMPSFWLAGVLYGARMIFNTLSIPVRQSFLMGSRGALRRGWDGELSRAGWLVDQPIRGEVPDAAGVVGVAAGNRRDVAGAERDSLLFLLSRGTAARRNQRRHWRTAMSRCASAGAVD